MRPCKPGRLHRSSGILQNTLNTQVTQDLQVWGMEDRDVDPKKHHPKKPGFYAPPRGPSVAARVTPWSDSARALSEQTARRSRGEDPATPRGGGLTLQREAELTRMSLRVRPFVGGPHARSAC